MGDRNAQLASFTTFGDLLKFLRKRAQLSQRELSIATGYSESQISRLEANLRAPNQASLKALFVPALSLRDEPETITRLFELAQKSRTSTVDQRYRNGIKVAPKTARPNNLPIQLTSFIGREVEISHLGQLIKSGMTRLVTLTGAGGVGKTRLAIRAAEELLDDFRDGVWLVELASVTNPDLLPQAIAAVLDLKETADLPVGDVLTHYLKNRVLLLVLDNCEHLIAACAELVDHLLHACPKVTILATSREALRIAGEQVHHVPSLTVPDPLNLPLLEELAQFEAVRLFTIRASASWPAFELNSENAPAVVEICQRLAGIPLAIELAAARVGVMSPDQIQSRLDQQFSLLSAGPRTAIPRHQTLHASIDWSYNLMSSKERILLQRLSIFSGGWTLEAAEGVCGFKGIGDFEVLDHLTSLVNQSLVVVIPETIPQPGGAMRRNAARYRMLETIRQYAVEQLIGDELHGINQVEEMKQRHLAYFSRLAGPAAYELLGPNQIAWVKLLTGELDNIRAALDWGLGTGSPGNWVDGLKLANALLYFWYFKGLGKEASSWLEAGLAHLTRQADAPPSLLGRTYKTAASTLFTMGDLDKAREYLKRSITLLRPLGPSYDLAEAIIWLIFVSAFNPSDLKERQAMWTEAIAIARQVGDPNLLGVCLFMSPFTDDVDKIRAHLEESARILEKNSDVLFLSNPNRLLKSLARLDGDFARARRYMEKTLAINRKYSMKLQITFDLLDLGELAYLEKQYNQMEAYFQECLDMAEEISFRQAMMWSVPALGVAARRQGQIDQAERCFQRGLAQAQEYGREERFLDNISGLAGVALERGLKADSVKLFGMVAAQGKNKLTFIHKAEFERDLAELRGQLTITDFQTAWEAGQTMTINQAVQLLPEIFI